MDGYPPLSSPPRAVADGYQANWQPSDNQGYGQYYIMAQYEQYAPSAFDQKSNATAFQLDPTVGSFVPNPTPVASSLYLPRSQAQISQTGNMSYTYSPASSASPLPPQFSMAQPHPMYHAAPGQPQTGYNTPGESKRKAQDSHPTANKKQKVVGSTAAPAPKKAPAKPKAPPKPKAAPKPKAPPKPKPNRTASASATGTSTTNGKRKAPEQDATTIKKQKVTSSGPANPVYPPMTAADKEKQRLYSLLDQTYGDQLTTGQKFHDMSLLYWYRWGKILFPSI